MVEAAGRKALMLLSKRILTALAVFYGPSPKPLQFGIDSFSLCITWGTQYECVHLTDFIMYAVKSI